jgi:8-oxo-dGTP pyrophosphatase MutT (NUDIX family)
MAQKWELSELKSVFKSLPFNIVEKLYIKPNNSGKFTAYVVDAPDWVNIIATNKNGEILLIEQFRFGTDEVELEIPGGIIEPDESPKAAAIRELKEETGYNIKDIKEIGEISANPAIMNNKCYTFWAELSSRGEQNLDPDEMVHVKKFASRSEVKDYLRDGKIKNAYCVLAFFWFFLEENLF